MPSVQFTPEDKFGNLGVYSSSFLKIFSLLLRRLQDRKVFAHISYNLRGSFSVVYKATEKNSNRVHAVKVIDKQKLGAKKMEMIETEVEILFKVRHPNIIKLEEVYETQDNVFMVM